MADGVREKTEIIKYRGKIKRTVYGEKVISDRCTYNTINDLYNEADKGKR